MLCFICSSSVRTCLLIVPIFENDETIIWSSSVILMLGCNKPKTSNAKIKIQVYIYRQVHSQSINFEIVLNAS